MLNKAHRITDSLHRPCAFTLVELLVVVSIVALLMAILAPSLKAAREQAKQLLCGTRLSQWSTAFSCYAAENNGIWPHCDGIDREDWDRDRPDAIPTGARPENVANWHGWVDMLPPLINHKKWRYFEKWNYPGPETFFQCPTARLLPDSEYSYKPRKTGYFSYAMNACLELDVSCFRPPGGDDWPMPSFLDTARIVAPQRVILLFDQLLDPKKGYGGNNDVTYKSAGQHCGTYPIVFSARHQRSKSNLGGNVLFCDGHVEWKKTVWKDDWGDWDIAGRQQGPPRNDPNWYPYPIPQGASNDQQQ